MKKENVNEEKNNKLVKMMKDALQGERKGEATEYDVLNNGIGAFFKKAGMKGEVDLGKPETLSKIAILVKDQKGYRLAPIKDAIDAIYEDMAEKKKDTINSANDKRVSLMNSGILKNNNNIDEELKDQERTLKSLTNDEKDIRTCAGARLIPLFTGGRIVFQNQKNEVNLMDYDGTKLRSLDPDEVQAALPDPDTRSCFRKFIDAVKEFFGAEKYEQRVEFIQKRDEFEFRKAQRTVMGLENPEKKVAQEEKQSKSAKKAEPKKKEPEKPKGKGM